MDTDQDMDVGFMPQMLYNLPHSELTFQLETLDTTVDDLRPDLASTGRDGTHAVQPGAVIAQIEDIFEAIIDCMLDDKKQLTIRLRTRSKKSNSIEKSNHPNDQRLRSNVKVIKFPTKSFSEARRFTALLHVLSASHEALIAGSTITKRDIYYRDPDLFVKQNLADRCVDDIAYTLSLQRDHLNIVAAAKGLIIGALKVHVSEDVVIDYRTASDGFLTPNIKSISKFESVDLKWILIIEKEATFRALATSRYWETSKVGNGLLITAKGYPDLQTRHLLNLLWATNPSTPIFALVDFDPDGLGIMSTYKYGSVNLAHERNANVPSLKWLGIRSSDVIRLNKHKRQEREPVGLIQLSARDRRIAIKMLAKEEIFGEHGKEREWRNEVQRMLMLNLKAEIQILGNQENMEKWLDTKIRAGKAAFKKTL